MFSDQLLSWFFKRNQQLPWRIKWNLTQDPYVLWVSEIMLQQTTIPAVKPVYERFFSIFPHVQDLAVAKEEDLRRAVAGLGYYRRFFLMQKAATIIVQQGWPTSAHEWKTLPGVGDYTSAILASLILKEPIGALDGNVHRVVSRLLALETSLLQGKKIITQALSQWICHHQPGAFNEAMMELGQTLCTPAKPDCPQCPIQHICQAKKLSVIHKCPPPKPKKEKQDVFLTLTIFINKDQKIGLIKRDKKEIFLKGSIGFSIKKLPTKSLTQMKSQYIGSFRHTITCHNITAYVYVEDHHDQIHSWIHKDEVKDHLMANLDRKAWNIWTQSESFC